jgi:uncharacterized protein (DUF2249 family)
MTKTLALPATGSLVDEHSVLLWQTCAYVENLTDAVQSRQRVAPAYDAMLQFLHYRLLPYLSKEERQLPPSKLRDEHLSRLLLADHERLRDDVDNIEGSRTRRLLTLASDVLVDRLDRHIRREESWIRNPSPGTVTDADADVDEWALPLLLSDDIDLDALPVDDRDRLVLHRLQQMRGNESVRLHAGYDLHPLWRRLHRCNPHSHVWVYEQEGPDQWTACVARRDPADC